MAAEQTVATSLWKLKLEDTSEYLFIWTRYDGDSLTLNVSDGVDSWSGVLSKEEMEVMADQTKISLNNYIEDTLKALTGKNIGNLSFWYSAKRSDNGSLQLIWKKHLASDNIKFHLGKVNLSPVSSRTIHCSFLNYAIDSMENLWQKIDNLEASLEQVTMERQSAISRLQNCALLQENLEKDLYGKFKLILNGKKSKIRKLMESKSHLTEQNEDMQRQLWEMKSHTKSSTSEEAKLLEEPSKRLLEGYCEKRSSQAVESLLGELQDRQRSTSPPPKRNRQDKGAGRGKIDIPCPPPLLSHNNCNTNSKIQVKDLEESVDSNELLHML